MSPLVNIEDTYGALFLGVVASVGLMGITTMQTWIYWIRYSKRDGLFTKTLVLVIWSLEFLRACFSVHAVYNYVVVEWGNPEALSVSIWSLNINTPFTSIIQIIVHSFFTYRVKVLSKNNWYIIGLIMIFAVANLASGLALYAEMILAQKVSKILGSDKLGDLGTAALSTAIAADISITCSLLFYMNRFRSTVSEEDYANRRTLPMINRLMFYLINVGAVTSLTDIVTLVLSDVLIHPSNLKFYALFEVVGNLYANSLLATLNARDSLRSISQVDSSITTSRNPTTGLNFAHPVNAINNAGTSVRLEDMSSVGRTSMKKVIGNDFTFDLSQDST